jgi:malate synthase
MDVMKRMAVIVDKQNASDPQPMWRWRRALTALRSRPPASLVFEGATQPSGYTEPLLHAARLKLKAQSAG